MRRLVVAGPALLAAAIVIPCTGTATWAASLRTAVTESQKVGDGSARLYVATDEAGAPLALGISFTKEALQGLPTTPNPESICVDRNDDGRVDPDGECLGDYSVRFALPDGEAAEAFAPFKWAMVNWNPHGHQAPAPPPWAAPHFDFHFYIADRASVDALRPGRCSELLDCADFEKAKKPVPARYVHPDHIDVGAAVPAMGNHLIDSKSPELAPGGPPFTETFIVGSYDGHVTFYEPMITHAYLASGPDACTPIKQPEGWEVAGYYPTKYCIRFSDDSGPHTVSLEGFVRREAN